MFEAAPVVDLIDTREIIQYLDSDPEFMGLQMESLVQLLKLGAKRSSYADLVCNFPHVEYEKLGLWTESTYRIENKLSFMSQFKNRIIVIRKLGLRSIQKL